MSELKCYCWASGLVEFTTGKIPKGTLLVATGSGIKWRQKMEQLFLLAYDNKSYLIREVGEAILHDKDPLQALRNFMRKLEKLGLRDPDTELGQQSLTKTS
jgi:hypothetical protein